MLIRALNEDVDASLAVAVLSPGIDRVGERFGSGRLCAVANLGMILADPLSRPKARQLDYLVGAPERHASAQRAVSRAVEAPRLGEARAATSSCRLPTVRKAGTALYDAPRPTNCTSGKRSLQPKLSALPIDRRPIYTTTGSLDIRWSAGYRGLGDRERMARFDRERYRLGVKCKYVRLVCQATVEIRRLDFGPYKQATCGFVATGAIAQRRVRLAYEYGHNVLSNGWHLQRKGEGRHVPSVE
jgi:hypothetical protein